MSFYPKPLDLDVYRELVNLDEVFKVSSQLQGSESGRSVAMDDLLSYFYSEETTESFNAPENRESLPYIEKRKLLRALLTVRNPEPLPPMIHDQVDRLLQWELLEKGVIDAVDLPPIMHVYPDSSYGAAEQCVVWQGDITALRVDAIVNAANSDMLGCFVPFHNCIDNIIHSYAGPRVREDCHKIMQLQDFREGTGWAKITRGYNLPSRYILHTVGPIIRGKRGRVPSEQEEQLSSCYRSCLDLASRLPGMRSVAFCCISTGVFGYPQLPAARVALKTVNQWLSDNPGRLDLVVFDVFRDDDFEIYKGLLKEW